MFIEKLKARQNHRNRIPFYNTLRQSPRILTGFNKWKGNAIKAKKIMRTLAYNLFRSLAQTTPNCRCLSFRTINIIQHVLVIWVLFKCCIRKPSSIVANFIIWPVSNNQRSPLLYVSVCDAYWFWSESINYDLFIVREQNKNNYLQFN